MTHARDPLLRVLERKPPRRGLASLPVIVFAVLATGCTTTATINPRDATAPQVRIFVWQEQEFQEVTGNGPHADYQNKTDSELQVVCSVYEPQGARTADLRVSDPRVDTATCGGTNYPGNHLLTPFPPASQSDGMLSQTTTRLSIGVGFVISGHLVLATNPPNSSGPCTPAHNSVISVRCRGTNYSADSHQSTTDKLLHIQFKTLSPP
jgi:hypothetical protein